MGPLLQMRNKIKFLLVCGIEPSWREGEFARESPSSPKHRARKEWLAGNRPARSHGSSFAPSANGV